MNTNNHSKMGVEKLPASIRALYPFTSHYFKQPEGQQHYLDEGAGSAILLLHGNPTWSFYYRDLVRHLGDQGFRCIVPDHIGCGLSDKPPEGSYRLQTHIDNVERLLEHLQLRKMHLVVHDWGGAIGMGLATRHPEWIENIVILNTSAFRGPRIPFRINVCRWPVIGEWMVRGLNAFAWPATFMTTDRPLSKAVKQGYLHPYGSWDDRIAIARFVQDIPMEANHPSSAVLDEIDQNLHRLQEHPMLIAWGGLDWCFHDWYYEEWRRRFPQAAYHYFEDAGHYVLEDAREDLLPRIETFLRS